MRRYRRERPAAIGFRGSELRWMALGIMTLVVLFLLISRFREAGAGLGLPSLINRPTSPVVAGDDRQAAPADRPHR